MKTYFKVLTVLCIGMILPTVLFECIIWIFTGHGFAGIVKAEDQGCIIMLYILVTMAAICGGIGIIEEKR